MKRPFAVVGITYLIAQTVAVLCGAAVTAVLFCMTLLCALFVVILVKERPAWLLPAVISCAVCFACNAGHHYLDIKPAQMLQGQSVYITGTICEAPRNSYGRIYYIIETDSVSLSAAPQRVKLRLSSGKELDAQYGDTIRTQVQFNYTELTSSTMRNLLADGVLLTAYLPYDAYPYISEGEATLYGSVLKLRDWFSEAALDLLGEELGSLLVGMFTGDTSGISERTLSYFRDCGLSHLFSVSGLHLSILVAALTVLLRRITPNYRATALMTIPFVLFFMAFSGFSMSIRRAGVMTLLSLIAMAVKREADALNSLGIAALLICVLNPNAAGDVGMLLSFASTFGLITLSWPVERRIRPLLRFDPKSRTAFILRPLINTVSTSLVAAVFTFPITALCFGEMSFISPIANALCIYPASALMIAGAVGAVLSQIPLIGPIIGFVVFVPVWFIGRLILALVGLLSMIPGAGVSVNYPFMAVFMLGAALIFLLCYALYRKDSEFASKVLLCCVMIIQVFMMSIAVHNVVNLQNKYIMIFDSNGGIMTSLVSGGRCVIVGAGGDSYCSWLASDKLADSNITKAVTIVLPDNTDRCAESAVDFITQYEPDTVFLSESGRRFELIEKECREQNIKMYHVENAQFSADGCDIRAATFLDANGMLWTWAECGELSMLICPEDGDCTLIPEEYTRPDIAVITSDSIVNVTNIKPTALIISSGRSEGRSAEAIMSYRGMKNIFSTTEDGCIIVTPSGEGIRVDQQ